MFSIREIDRQRANCHVNSLISAFSYITLPLNVAPGYGRGARIGQWGICKMKIIYSVFLAVAIFTFPMTASALTFKKG